MKWVNKNGKNKGQKSNCAMLMCKIGRNSCFESRAKILDQSFPIVLTSVRLIYLKQSASHGRFMVLWNSFRMSEKLSFCRKND